MNMLTKLLLALAILSTSLLAQPSNYQLAAPPPPSTSNITASVVGQQGGGTNYFYWVVAQYPIGHALAAGPGIAFSAQPTLSVSNFNRVNWQAQTGATGYTVLRTSTNTAPFNTSSTCTCAVVVNTPVTTADDIGSALVSFTILPANPALGSIVLDNVNFAVPTIVITPAIFNPAIINYDKATFVLCNGTACAVGSNLTNEYIVVNAGTLVSCRAFAKVAPVGADLIIDINNGTSIFGATKLVIADGAQTGSQSTFVAPTVAVDDLLTADVDQIGSGTAGETVTVVCNWTF